MPVPHHLAFYRLDAVPAAQQTGLVSILRKCSLSHCTVKLLTNTVNYVLKVYAYRNKQEAVNYNSPRSWVTSDKITKFSKYVAANLHHILMTSRRLQSLHVNSSKPNLHAVGWVAGRASGL